MRNSHRQQISNIQRHIDDNYIRAISEKLAILHPRLSQNDRVPFVRSNIKLRSKLLLEKFLFSNSDLFFTVYVLHYNCSGDSRLINSKPIYIASKWPYILSQSQR